MASTIKVDNIQNAAGTSALSIDSSGRVTTPSKPFIQLLRNANASYTAGTTITDWRVNDSRGITISGGVMTVPTAGLYQLGISCIANGNSAGIHLYIQNTLIYRISYASLGTGESWSVIGGDGVFNLNANDEVKFVAANSTLSLYGETGNGTVGGAYMYLVG